MFRVVILFVLIMGISTNAADTSVDKMLKASSSLIFDAEKGSIELMKENLETYKNVPHVQDSIARVVGYALLRKRKSEFEKFKEEVSGKYPKIDFSFAEEIVPDYDNAIKVSASNLALNVSSAILVEEGNSPSKIEVHPRENATEEFTGGSNVNNEEDPLEPLKIPVEDKVEEDPADKKEMAKVDKKLPSEEEVGKTKSNDIAKDSIYYKVYHAAVKAQKNDSAGVKELYALTFEEKNEVLTEGIIKAITLGMLSAKSSAVNSYVTKINEEYEDNSYLSFLEEEPFQVKCRTCSGSGHRESKCKDCLNGSCRNCKGKGQISYRGLGGATETKTCPTCQGQKSCKTCNGEKIQKKDCRTCGTKGTYLNRAIFATEYKAAIQYLIDLAPKMADDEGLYIGVGVNKLALARLEALKMAKEERAARKAEEAKHREMARLAEENKRKEMEKKKKMEEEGSVIVVEEAVEGGTNATLDHAVLEVRNFIQAQEKRQKTSLMDSCNGKFEETRPTLYINVNKGFTGAGKGYKEQVVDGWYRFWQLRAGQNGLGKKVVLKIVHDGTTIGLAKDGNVKVK